MAKTLAKHFKNIDNIIRADHEALIAAEDIGEKIAESVNSFFQEDYNLALIDRLKSYGLNFEIEENENSSHKLEGLKFVISGVFKKYERNELKKLIELHGGKNVSSLSKNTDYLIAGDNMGPSKKEKAEKLSIPMIDENAFEKMIS